MTIKTKKQLQHGWDIFVPPHYICIEKMRYRANEYSYINFTDEQHIELHNWFLENKYHKICYVKIYEGEI